jgi:hypothetical protein
MTEQASTLTRHDLEAKIVRRCWINEDFRKEFTFDPTGAAAKYLQVPAAKLPRIMVHEEPAGSWHIVIPSKRASGNEISEQDLEGIAGGSVFKENLVRTAVTVLLSGVLTVGSAAASAKYDQGW